ncbi:unnamed protein product [Sphagnum balticum]
MAMEFDGAPQSKDNAEPGVAETALNHEIPSTKGSKGAGLILSGRRMVEDERALMELRLVGLEEGCNEGIKEERCGESRDRAK